jgi:hypothetical protein
MTFFNKKEEVFELKLTRLGREKLSKGQFIPTHYEFVDEDILYDKRNISFTGDSFEEQNEIKDRIKENAMTLRMQTSIQGVKDGTIADNPENKLIESLGTFTPYSNYKPAWQIEADDGLLFTGSGPIDYTPIEVNKNGSVGPSYEKIPQLSLSCSYNYNFFVDVDKHNTETSFFSDVLENPYIDIEDLFKKTEHDSFVLFKKDFNDFTISVSEENVLSSSNQFEMEIFKYEYSNDFKNVNAERLFFEADDITDESVEWFFNVSFDAEIGPQKEGFVFVDEPLEINTIDDECGLTTLQTKAELDKCVQKCYAGVKKCVEKCTDPANYALCAAACSAPAQACHQMCKAKFSNVPQAGY